MLSVFCKFISNKVNDNYKYLFFNSFFFAFYALPAKFECSKIWPSVNFELPNPVLYGQNRRRYTRTCDKTKRRRCIWVRPFCLNVKQILLKHHRPDGNIPTRYTRLGHMRSDSDDLTDECPFRDQLQNETYVRTYTH